MQDVPRALQSAFDDIARAEERLGATLHTLAKRESRLAALERQLADTQKRLAAARQLAPTMVETQLRAVVDEHRFWMTRLFALAAAPKWPWGQRRRDSLIAAAEATALARLLMAVSGGELVKQNVAHAADLTAARALRSTLVRTHTGEEPVLALAETTDRGVHSMILPCPGVTAQALHRVCLQLRSAGTPFVRVRVRSARDMSNRADCVVDLRELEARFVTSVNPVSPNWVRFQALDEAWVEVEFFAFLHASGSPVEIELISMPVASRTSQHPGNPARGFAVRRVEAWRIELVPQEMRAAANPAQLLIKMSAGAQVHAESRASQSQGDEGEDDLAARHPATLPDPAPAHPAVADSATVDPAVVGADTPSPSPGAPSAARLARDEAQRRTLRKAYLASGAYDRIAALRNRHVGRRAFIIGNGPSIRSQDLTRLRDEVTFVTNWFVNHPDFAAIDPKYYCVSSHEMFGGWKTAAPALNPDWLARMRAVPDRSLKVFSHRFRAHILGDGIFAEDETAFLLFGRPKQTVDEVGALNLDLTAPMLDGYTGIITFCLPLAFHMGITEIYLLGCESDYAIQPNSDAKSYFYDYSQHQSSTTTTDSLLRVWADNGPVFTAYAIARDRFAAEGIPIVNCTPGGRLDVFPRMPFERVLDLGRTRGAS